MVERKEKLLEGFWIFIVCCLIMDESVEIQINIASRVAYFLSGPLSPQWVSGITKKPFGLLFCKTFFIQTQMTLVMQRILQVPDVLLYGFQTLWNGGGGLVRRHTRYRNLRDRASKRFHWFCSVPDSPVTRTCVTCLKRSDSFTIKKPHHYMSA